MSDATKPIAKGQSFTDKQKESFTKHDNETQDRLRDIQFKLEKMLTLYEHIRKDVLNLKHESESMHVYLKKPWYKR